MGLFSFQAAFFCGARDEHHDDRPDMENHGGATIWTGQQAHAQQSAGGQPGFCYRAAQALVKASGHDFDLMYVFRLLHKGHFTAETQRTQRPYLEKLCALGVSAVSYCGEFTFI